MSRLVAREIAPGDWLPLAVPPAAFATQELLSWFVASHACPGDPGHAALWSVAVARTLLVVIALIALGVTGVALLESAARWKRAGQSSDSPATDRTAFLALAGMIVAGTLLLGMLWLGLSSAIVPMCGNGA